MTRRSIVKHSPLRNVLRRAGPPAAILIVVAFFGAYAVIGPNGALAYGDIRRQLAAKGAELDRLREQRAELKNRVDLLDPAHPDPDLADELTRKNLNVAHPNEVIVPLN